MEQRHTPPDPRTCGVAQWALYRAAQHRARWVVATGLFGVLGIFVSVAFKAPTDSSSRTTVLYALAGLGIALGGVFILSVLYACVFAPYEQRKELRAIVGGYEQRQPELVIETGNGKPWDDPRHAPHPFEGGIVSGAWLQLTAMSKQGDPEDIPANGYAKRLRVENVGPVPARNSWAFVVQPGLPNVTLLWEKIGSAFHEERWDLYPGEPAYLLLPGHAFTEAGTHDVEVRVFAENMAMPKVERYSVEVTSKTFPQIGPPASAVAVPIERPVP